MFEKFENITEDVLLDINRGNILIKETVGLSQRRDKSWTMIRTQKVETRNPESGMQLRFTQ